MVLSLSVHGFDSPGLAHSLALTEDISLSGLDIMRAVFPRILMLNACFSTSLDPRRGVEPVGLGTLALCRGAEAVVGGQFPLPDGEDDEYGFATSAIVASVYQSLSRGDDLAESVRSAQAEWLNEHPDAPPFWWAGWMVLEAPRGE